MIAPKLRFKEFDGNWDTYALEDQIDFLAGYAFDSKLMSNDIKNYQLIKMSNVYQNQLDLTRNSSYWEKTDKKTEKFLLKKGDIVLTLTGTVGKTDYGYNVEIKENDKFLLNQRLVRLRGKIDFSLSKFVQYRISTDKFFYHFFNSSKGGTGNQSNVSIEDLKLLELPFPLKAEQIQIATFLSSVDEKISQLTQKLHLLGQYKQGMMQKLFSQQIRFKADDGAEFGEWRKMALGSFCIRNYQGINTVADKVEYQPHGYPILQAKHITSEKLDFVDVRYLSDLDYEKYKEKYIPQLNDILFSNIGTIGKVVLVNESKSFFIAWNIFLISIKLNVANPSYITAYLRWLTSLNYFDNLQTGNATKFINKTDLLDTKVNLPYLEEQTKIANFLSAIDQKIDVVSEQLEQAKLWKKGLLQQMFV